MSKEKNNKQEKNLFNVFSNMTKKTVSSIKTISNNIKANSEKTKINEKILEHKYNIGKLIYDNEIEINDGVVISNVNSISRLIKEIEEYGGKRNGKKEKELAW